MTAETVWAVECLRLVMNPTAGERWRSFGAPALDLVVETMTDDGPMRLGSPRRPSWVRTMKKWGQYGAPRALVASACRGDVRLVAVPRGRPDPVAVVLAESTQPIAVSEAASWIGWPRPGDLGVWPVTVKEHLALRGNDYWPVELTSDALGLGRVVDTSMPSVPFRGGVSVVVPARDVHDVLAGTVEAICVAAACLPDPTPWECIIVDDASDPPLVLPAGCPPEVELLRSDSQVFCGGARNLGLGRAAFDLVVFCDADTRPAPDYLVQHVARHVLAGNLVTISLRDHVPAGEAVPDRAPDGSRDTRVMARYEPGRLGLVPVEAPVTVRPLDQTRQFRDFGGGVHLGPVDLPFMVKGNNLAVSRDAACRVRFPPDFRGWGPEDVCFGAKLIAQGMFVVPVTSTGVFHVDHPPRSGSGARRDEELAANLRRYAAHLDGPADGGWLSPGEGARR